MGGLPHAAVEVATQIVDTSFQCDDDFDNDFGDPAAARAVNSMEHDGFAAPPEGGDVPPEGGDVDVQLSQYVEKLNALAATTVFCDEKATLFEKQTQQRKRDAELVVVRGDKETLEAAHGGSFQKLKGECEPGKVDALYGEVKTIIGKLQIENFLLPALKNTLTKPPSARGPFDILVVDQFEEALLADIGELAAYN